MRHDERALFSNSYDVDYSDDENADPLGIRQLFPTKTEKLKIPSFGKMEYRKKDFFLFGTLFLLVAGITILAVFHTEKKTSLGGVASITLKDGLENESYKREDIYNEIRLPGNIKPLHYELLVHPNLERKDLIGSVEILFECKESLTEIVIHSSRLTIHTKQLNDLEGHEIGIIDSRENKKWEYMIFKLDQMLEPSKKYKLLLGFQKELKYVPSDGVYLSDFTDGDGNKHRMLSTMFESTTARYAFPCFDEPELKAQFTIIIRHDHSNGYNANSNMPVDNINITNTVTETRFRTSPLMSTYLVGFTVNPYVYEERFTKSGIPVRIYAPDGRLSEAKYAVILAAYVLDFYIDKFGIDYPLPKLDMIPVTSFESGGDEVWGMIVVLERSLLIPKDVSRSNLNSASHTIAHEITHMWFGDLVTPSWWTDVWLKEAMATYMSDNPIKSLYPSWDLRTPFYSDKINGPMLNDFGDHTHPIVTTEEDPKVLRTNYDQITYQKGAAVVYMMSNYLGEDLFYQGLHNYLETYKFGNANVSQFWEAFPEVESGLDLEDIMNNWVDKSGFPLVSINRNGPKLELTQEKFSTDEDKQIESTLWHIPLSIKFQNYPQPSNFLFSKKSNTLSYQEDENSWYKANYGATGYFRVNYDDTNWQNLLAQFNNDHTVFSAVDRSNILADINAIEQADYRPIHYSLEFSKYLKKERHHIPWEFGISAIADAVSMFKGSKEGDCAKKYMANLVNTVLDELNKHETHTSQEKDLINFLIPKAIQSGNTTILIELENMFLRWIFSSGSLKLPQELRPLIFQIGMMTSGENSVIWEKLLQYYKESTSAIDGYSILSGLSLTKNLTLLERLTNEKTGTKLLGEDDYITSLGNICLNEVGRDIALAAVERNWKWIYKRIRPSPSQIPTLLNSCLGGRSTQVVNDFFNTHEVGGFIKVKNSLLDHEVANSDNSQKKRNEIQVWLHNNLQECLYEGSLDSRMFG